MEVLNYKKMVSTLLWCSTNLETTVKQNHDTNQSLLHQKKKDLDVICVSKITPTNSSQELHQLLAVRPNKFRLSLVYRQIQQKEKEN